MIDMGLGGQDPKHSSRAEKFFCVRFAKVLCGPVEL